jgi:hypothetical protein
MEALARVEPSSLESQAVEAVEAVLAVEEYLDWEGATQRIPVDLRGQTFFGEFDFWLYTAIDDDKTCWMCKVRDKIIWTGLELRSSFPWLQIVDANTIMAKTHPHCRCPLTRITSLADYIQLAW